MQETSYKLPDFYNKSFLEGGPTLSQVTNLYALLQKSKSDRLKFEATIHGVELGTGKGCKKEQNKTTNDLMVFKDPAEYANMSKEELTALTDRMIGEHTKTLGATIDGK